MLNTAIRQWLLAGVLALGLTGCASAPPLPPAPTIDEIVQMSKDGLTPDEIIRRLDEKIAEAEPQAPATKHDTVSPQPPEKPKPEQHAATAPVKRAEPAPPAAKPPVTSPWTADTKPDDAYKTPDLAMRVTR